MSEGSVSEWRQWTLHPLKLVLILCYLNRVTRVYLSMLHAWSTKAASLPKLVDPVFIPASPRGVIAPAQSGGSCGYCELTRILPQAEQKGKQDHPTFFPTSLFIYSFSNTTVLPDWTSSFQILIWSSCVKSVVNENLLACHLLFVFF